MQRRCSLVKAMNYDFNDTVYIEKFETQETWKMVSNIPAGKSKFRRWINVEISTSIFQRIFDAK